MKLIDRKNLNYSGIYKITNILNNHCYIGQAKNIKLRIYYHLNSTYNSKKKDYNYPLHQAIRKYGVDNFNLEVLEKCSEDELNKKEIFYIQKYHSCKLDSKYVGGYNLTSGGKQHIRHIKLTREQVIQIYELLVNTQLSFKDIAFRFNVSSDLVYRINIGRVWHDNTLNYPIRLVPHIDVFKKYNYSGTCICQIDVKTQKILARFISVKAASLSGFKDLKHTSHIREASNGKRKTAYGFMWKREYINKQDWLELLNNMLKISK